MFTNLLGTPGLGGLITALAFIGAVVALTITGHISGADALAALGILGGGATAVTATHVTGNALTKAAGPTGTDSPGAATGTVQPAPAQSPPVPGPAASTVTV